MRISKTGGKSLYFCDVAVGQVFSFEDSLFMRTGPLYTKHGDKYSEINAIKLDDGVPGCFVGAASVRVISGEFVW